MAYRQGDIVWAWLPFSNGTGGENKPVLVVSTGNHGKDITVAQISSQVHKARRRRRDYILKRWADAGFDRPKVLRPKLFVILKGRVSGRVGMLHDDDKVGMLALLKELFGL